MYLTVNGKPSCRSNLTWGKGYEDHSVVCAHGTIESAERDAQKIRSVHPDAVVEIKDGFCPARAEDDEANCDPYEPDPWDRFLAGNWTMEPPTKAGVYPIADRDGNQAIMPFVVAKLPDGELHYSMLGRSSMCGSDIWQGWFWSQPIPNLPNPPKR